MNKQDVEDLVRDASYWLGASEERLTAALQKWPAERRAVGVVRVMAALEESRMPAPRPPVLELLTGWLTAARLREEAARRGKGPVDEGEEARLRFLAAGVARRMVAAADGARGDAEGAEMETAEGAKGREGARRGAK